MPLVTTDAIVLHVFDYSESSRIFRLATRDAGIVSALARGVRRPRSRFGSALDLFTDGTAALYVKDARELQTLAGFDVLNARPALAADLDRFTGAAAIGEIVLRFGTSDAASSPLFDALIGALDALAVAAADPPHVAILAGLAGAWRLLAVLGFGPALDTCGACHAPLPPDAQLPFSHAMGGVLCARCGRLSERPWSSPSGRRLLPARARDLLRQWTGGSRALPGDGCAPDQRDVRAHQRLLREFVQYHLSDGRPLRAFEVWEHGRWGAR